MTFDKAEFKNELSNLWNLNGDRTLLLYFFRVLMLLISPVFLFICLLVSVKLK